MTDNIDIHRLIDRPIEHLDATQRRWLKPLGIVAGGLRAILFGINRLVMRMLFGARAIGLEHLPDGTFLLCPNHTSSLDPAAILSLIDYRTARQLRWAGRRGAVLTNPFRRFANRLAGTIPLDRDLSALAVGAAALREGYSLGWFPEGTRTTTGEMREFKPGVGMLMATLGTPAVPVYIHGAFEAWPPTRKLPRKLCRIEVRFGPPLLPRDFVQDEWDEQTAIDKLTEELRRRVKELGDRG